MTAIRTVPRATPEERERIERIAALIEAERPDIERRYWMCVAAEQEPGFNGDLRRAIHTGGVPLEKLADAAQLHVFGLCDFLEGTAELTSSQIAAIVQLLGLQLVRTIPREPPRKNSTTG
jgi:hypothetical protein